MVDNSTGYTLIEVLVVLFIISIVTSVALLTISRNENRQMEVVANELAQTLTLAEEQAMLQTMVLGLLVSEHAFQFEAYQASSDGKQARWVPHDDTMLARHELAEDIHLDVLVEGKHLSSSAVPQVIISTNGDITPFTIYVGKKGEKPRYIVKGDTDGSVSTKLIP